MFSCFLKKLIFFGTYSSSVFGGWIFVCLVFGLSFVGSVGLETCPLLCLDDRLELNPDYDIPDKVVGRDLCCFSFGPAASNSLVASAFLILWPPTAAAAAVTEVDFPPLITPLLFFNYSALKVSTGNSNIVASGEILFCFGAYFLDLPLFASTRGFRLTLMLYIYCGYDILLKLGYEEV